MKQWTIQTNDPTDTERLGHAIGATLTGGEVIELISDLGGGKTTITRGITRGIQSDDLVSSPTFTISNQYQGAGLTIRHYDFYRLDMLGLMKEELAEAMEDDKTVVVVEWAGEAADLFTDEKRIRITLKPVAHDENNREITVEVSDERAAVFDVLMTGLEL